MKMESFLIMAFLTIQTAFAQASPPEFEQVCSTSNPAVCAELKFISEISSMTPGEFVIHIITPDETAVSLFKSNLWMGMGDHGHGSAPLKITPLENNQFLIKNAHFVMAGTWLIRLDFNIGVDSYHLEFSVDVPMTR